MIRTEEVRNIWKRTTAFIVYAAKMSTSTATQQGPKKSLRLANVLSEIEGCSLLIRNTINNIPFLKHHRVFNRVLNYLQAESSAVPDVVTKWEAHSRGFLRAAPAQVHLLQNHCSAE